MSLLSKASSNDCENAIDRFRKRFQQVAVDLYDCERTENDSMRLHSVSADFKNDFERFLKISNDLENDVEQLH